MDVSYKTGKYLQLRQKAWVNHVQVNVKSVFDDLGNVLTQPLGNVNLKAYRKDRKIFLSFSVPGEIYCLHSQFMPLSGSTLSPGELSQH